MNTTELTLAENMYIDNNDAIDLSNTGLTLQKDAGSGVSIVCYTYELLRYESGDYYIDTINYKPVESGKVGETLVTDTIHDEDGKFIVDLFDNQEY